MSDTPSGTMNDLTDPFAGDASGCFVSVLDRLEPGEWILWSRAALQTMAESEGITAELLKQAARGLLADRAIEVRGEGANREVRLSITINPEEGKKIAQAIADIPMDGDIAELEKVLCRIERNIGKPIPRVRQDLVDIRVAQGKVGNPCDCQTREEWDKVLREIRPQDYQEETEPEETPRETISTGALALGAEMKECAGNWLFADGGVIGANPSATGGVYAWVRIRDGVLVEQFADVVLPSEIGGQPITNNLTELMAVTHGISYLSDGWVGTIVSDSHVTLCRRFPGAKYNNVPPHVEKMARSMFADVLPHCRFILVDGHPTIEQLQAGIGKRGNPVSKWNVFCDDLCNETKRKFYAEQ